MERYAVMTILGKPKAQAAGYYIADQRRNAREQSRQIKMLTWGTNPTLRVKVHNHSGNPIYGVRGYAQQVSFPRMLARQQKWFYEPCDYLNPIDDNDDADYDWKYWESAPYIFSSTGGNILISDFLAPDGVSEIDFGVYGRFRGSGSCPRG